MSTHALKKTIMAAAAQHWLAASDLVAITMNADGPHEYGRARELALEAAGSLVSEGLLVAGTVEDGGYLPWGVTGADASRKLKNEWDSAEINSTWFAPATPGVQFGSQPSNPRDGAADQVRADAPSARAGSDAGTSSIQVGKETRLRAVTRPDLGPPKWEGSRLRRQLLLKRVTAIGIIALATAGFGWQVVDGVGHSLATYTKTEGTVTARTDTSSRHSDECQLDVDYSVNAHALHSVAKVNANCTTLPGPGSRAQLDVNNSDPHDIWIDGVSDAGHADPAFSLMILVVGVPGITLALMNWLKDYSGIQKLLASGAQWQQIEATVTRVSGGTTGVQARLEAADPSGTPRPFFVNYRIVSPIGDIRKGSRVTLVLMATGAWEALVWRPDLERVRVVHISCPRRQP